MDQTIPDSRQIENAADACEQQEGGLYPNSANIAAVNADLIPCVASVSLPSEDSKHGGSREEIILSDRVETGPASMVSAPPTANSDEPPGCCGASSEIAQGSILLHIEGMEVASVLESARCTTDEAEQRSSEKFKFTDYSEALNEHIVAESVSSSMPSLRGHTGCGTIVSATMLVSQEGSDPVGVDSIHQADGVRNAGGLVAPVPLMGGFPRRGLLRPILKRPGRVFERTTVTNWQLTQSNVGAPSAAVTSSRARSLLAAAGPWRSGADVRPPCSKVTISHFD